MVRHISWRYDINKRCAAATYPIATLPCAQICNASTPPPPTHETTHVHPFPPEEVRNVCADHS